MLLYSKNPDDIRKAPENLAKYFDKYNLKVNINKTKIIKFRKGGKLTHLHRAL